MRRPGFEPGLPDWQSDVLDQTGRPSHIRNLNSSVFKVLFHEFWFMEIMVEYPLFSDTKSFLHSSTIVVNDMTSLSEHFVASITIKSSNTSTNSKLFLLIV